MYFLHYPWYQSSIPCMRSSVCGWVPKNVLGVAVVPGLNKKDPNVPRLCWSNSQHCQSGHFRNSTKTWLREIWGHPVHWSHMFLKVDLYTTHHHIEIPLCPKYLRVYFMMSWWQINSAWLSNSFIWLSRFFDRCILMFSIKMPSLTKLVSLATVGSSVLVGPTVSVGPVE